MITRSILSAAALTLLGACGAPTSPAAFTTTALATTQTNSDASNQGNGRRQGGGQQNGGQQGSDKDCSDSRGRTTCYPVQYTETSTRVVYGSCVAGPSGVPGRSTVTYTDTYLVTVTRTGTTRVLISSREISRTCEPL
jgi:hypothetical protein